MFISDEEFLPTSRKLNGDTQNYLICRWSELHRSQCYIKENFNNKHVSSFYCHHRDGAIEDCDSKLFHKSKYNSGHCGERRRVLVYNNAQLSCDTRIIYCCHSDDINRNMDYYTKLFIDTYVDKIPRPA